MLQHCRKTTMIFIGFAKGWMVRWMCNVKVKDRVPSKELRGIDDMILILWQNRLRWYRHVLRKEDRLIGWRKLWNMRWRSPVQEVDQTGSGERLWKEECQARNLNRQDVMDRSRWNKKDWMMIRMVGGWVFLLVPAHPGSPGQRAGKRLLLLLLLLLLAVQQLHFFLTF